MVEGGAANSAISEKLIESVVEYIIRKEDLLQKLGELLKLNDFEKKGENYDKSDISKFLIDKSVVIGDVINLILENFEKNKVESKEFLEQVNKVRGMEKELETLGNGLLAQGLISGAAVTTLTGALAGLLTVGGVTGTLIVGGAAFIGFVALVAIAAIGYAIYQHRGEIQKGAIKAGRAVSRFINHVRDEMPEFKTGEKCIENLYTTSLRKREELKESKENESKENEIDKLDETIEIIKMLRDENQSSAIEELMKEGNIPKFEEMEKLLSKGNRNLKLYMETFKGLFDKFKDAILTNEGLDNLKKKVNKKVQEMRPSPEVENPSSERVNEEGKGVS
ncbi:MAG: glycine zipper family protein [Wolbachia pipientis]